MIQLLSCPQGHRWTLHDADSGTASERPPCCPECGAAGALVLAADGSTGASQVVLGSSAPSPVDDCATVPPWECAPPVAAAYSGSIPGYEILGELGRGGMGVVYKARQTKLKRMVALKMILAGVHAGPRELARFHTEAEAVARLQHPNIVQIYEVGDAEGRPYLALEFIGGGTLSQRMDGTPQPPRRAAQTTESLARAMHAAHQAGVVHRDLKPANVLLAVDGTPKIADFGLAKQLTDQGPTQTEAILGTPSYMAPEQASGKLRDIGPATDQYALGAILYELLTGQPPFRGETKIDTLEQVRGQEPVPPRRVNPRVPRDLETICLTCLQKEPRKRYASADALADDLQRFLADSPIQARPVGRLERAWKWARRRPAVASLLAGLVFTFLAGFAGVTWGYFTAEVARRRAEEARELAQSARQQEAEQRERAETHLYYSRLAEARLEWQANNAARAQDLLEQCEPARRGWEWRCLDNLFHPELFALEHALTGPYVFQIAYSRDGRFLASAGGGNPFYGAQGRETIRPGEVLVWDADAGRRLHVLKGHGNVVRAVAFGANGRLLASSGEDHALRLWDRASGKELRTLDGGSAWFTALAFHPGGRCLAAAASDGTVRVWDPVDLRPLRTTVYGKVGKSGPAALVCIAYSPDGSRLTVADATGRLTVSDADTGRVLAEAGGHSGLVTGLASSPDGHRLASAGIDGVARVWDAANLRLLQTCHGHVGYVFGVAYGPDGRTLATAGGDNTVRLWDAGSGREQTVLRGHAMPVRSVCFRPDGRQLASCDNGGSVRVWDLTRHPEYIRQEARGGDRDCEALAFTPDGRDLLCVRKGATVDTTEARTGLFRGRHWIELNHEWVTPARIAAFSGDGRRLATIGRDVTRVYLWDAATGRELFAARSQSQRLWDVAVNADGSRVAAAGCRRTDDALAWGVQVWDTGSRAPVLTLRMGRAVLPLGHDLPKSHRGGLALSPDGRLLAFGASTPPPPGGDPESVPATVRVWDVHVGKQRFVLEGHKVFVSALAFRPDGRRLASVGADGRLFVWDLATGHAVHSAATTDLLYSLAFTPDGRLLAGASRDRVVVWDAETGQDVLTLRGAPQRSSDPGISPRIAFSPDGSWLAANNWDNTVSVWDARPRTPETRADLIRAADERARAMIVGALARMTAGSF